MITVAALAGAAVVVGVALVVSGLRPAPGRPPSPRGRRPHRPAGGTGAARVGWAALAGLVVLVVTRWPVAAIGAAVAVYVLWGRRAGRPRGTVAIERTEAIAMWAELLRDATGTARGIEGILVATAADTPEVIRPDGGALRPTARIRADRAGAPGPGGRAGPRGRRPGGDRVGDRGGGRGTADPQRARRPGPRRPGTGRGAAPPGSRPGTAPLRDAPGRGDRGGDGGGAEPGGRRLPRPLPQRSRGRSCCWWSRRSGASGSGPWPAWPAPTRSSGSSSPQPSRQGASDDRGVARRAGLRAGYLAGGRRPVAPTRTTDRGAGPLHRTRPHPPAGGGPLGPAARPSRSRPRPGPGPGRRPGAGRSAGGGPRTGGPRRRDGRVRAVRPGAGPVVRVRDLAGGRPLPDGGRRRAQPGRRTRRRRAAVAVAARPGRRPPGRVLPRAGRLLPRVRHVPRGRAAVSSRP